MKTETNTKRAENILKYFLLKHDKKDPIDFIVEIRTGTVDTCAARGLDGGGASVLGRVGAAAFLRFFAAAEK